VVDGTTVAIMQPTYLPWLGWFDLMDQADVFVVLDSVQFERHSWQHRNRIKSANGEVMLSVPVKRTGLDTTIRDAELSDPGAVRRHLLTIKGSYARAGHLEPAIGALERLYEEPGPLLCDLLLPIIVWCREVLRIETPVVRSGELDVEGKKDHLVRSICDAVGATRYLATAGSAEYMAAGDAFDDGLVDVTYHDYEPVPYRQLHGDFVPRLAALDAILNVGGDARQVMIDGRRGRAA
jgi:hypothetical protein